MRTVKFVLAGLACAGHARRVNVPVENDLSPESDALAALLLASNPAVAFQNPFQASAPRGDANKVAKDLGAKALAAGLAGVLALTAGTDGAHAGPFTREDLQSLTYDQIKGSGLANTCPKVNKGGAGSIKVGKGLNDFCLQPTSFSILEERLNGQKGVETIPVAAKVTTRQTYVLDGMEGKFENKDGKLSFIEKDGIDYAPTTIQLPGGERVAFLFTIKNWIAQASSADTISPGFTLSGKFMVPSYRTGLFLDPKGRGTTTGYDQAVALPGMQVGGDEEMFNENNKKFDVGQGSLELKVTSVNPELKEIGGVFVQQQPSDTDLGTKEPKEVLLKGEWFATVE